MIRYLLTFLLILTAVPSFAAETSGTVEDDIFQSGNRFAEMGEWDRSLESYRTLLDQGIKSPELFQNLSYVYRQKGEAYRAAAWLYRAAELRPRDPRIQILIENEAAALGRSGKRLDAIARRAAHRFYPYEWALGAGGLLLAAALLYRFRRTRNGEPSRFLIAGSATILVLGMVCCVFLGYRINHIQSPRTLVTSETAVRSGPGDRFQVLSTLSSGTIVTVEGHEDNGYSQVRLPDGESGYIPQNDHEILAL